MPDVAAASWALVLAAHRHPAPPDAGTYRLGARGALVSTGSGDARDAGACLHWDEARGWRGPGDLDDDTRALLDLYLPLCTARARGVATVVGHLGQSLDGHIALDSGDSRFVTGPQNIAHLHRMRALSDAVVVGAETVAQDDPRLTTRKVDGDDAVRVVLDPGRRLDVGRGVFRDGLAPTIVLCARERVGHGRIGQAEVIGIPVLEDGRLDLHAALDVLRERGLGTVFVEGGGVTVSALLEARLLDRLQITVAPLIIGTGRRGLHLPAPAALDRCPRPPTRIYRMGEDVLFDCDLRAGDARDSGARLSALP